MDNDCNKIFTLVESKYDKIKQQFTIAVKKSLKKDFNEDVFHDTILKCSEKEWSEDVTDEDLLNYLFMAYRTNLIREGQYACNKYTVITDDFPDIPLNDIEDNYDYYDLIDKIKSYITKQYNAKTFEECYDRVVYGKSIKKLEKEYQDTNLRYKLDKIKKEVKKIIK